MNVIRVLIVDDHRVVAEGLALALSRDPAVEIIGMAGTAEEAVRLAEDEQPDVVLLDFHLPDALGDSASRAIRACCPRAAVVILTADSSDDTMIAAVDAGASGFLLKSQAATQVISAVHRASEGEMLIPASMLAGLLGRQRAQMQGWRQSEAVMTETLTVREQEVLALMAEGLDNRAIADKLIISYTTVRSHVQKILDKLGAHSKLQAVAQASEQGLLSR